MTKRADELKAGDNIQIGGVGRFRKIAHIVPFGSHRVTVYFMNSEMDSIQGDALVPVR